MLRVNIFHFLFFENFIQCCLIIFTSSPNSSQLFPFSYLPNLCLLLVVFKPTTYSLYWTYSLRCVAFCSGVVALIEVTPLRRLTLPLPAIANNSLARCHIMTTSILSILGCGLVWYCSGFVYTVRTTVSSSVQLSYYVWKNFIVIYTSAS